MTDGRRGVPEAILACYGRIGTEHAVDALVEHATDDRPHGSRRGDPALGSTQSARAETLLIELAQKPGDPAQATAIARSARSAATPPSRR